MKKALIFTSVLLFSMITSCISPSSLTLNNSSSKSNTFEELKTQELNNNKKIIELIKNKKKFDGEIDITVNTGLLNDKFTTKANTTYNRKKIWLVGEHSTNKSHNGDSQIFDPSKPNTGLTPYDGDVIDQTSNFKISSAKVNGTDELKFEPSIVLLELNDKSNLNLFKSLYDAQVIDELSNYYKLKVNIDKAPIQNLQSLLQEYNKSIPVNITSVEFSSLASMKTFAIILDFALNHKSLVKNIIVDTQSTELPITTPFIPNDLYIKNPSKPISGWWLNDTNVTDIWNYSIGSDVTIGWLEMNGFKPEHPEISRRIVDYGNNNASFSATKSGSSIVDSELYIFSDLAKRLNGDNSEGQVFHGHYSLMTCCAERNNGITTSGVAPNVNVAPYSFQGIFGMAASINRAKNSKVSVIGINQDFTHFIWGAISAVSQDGLFLISNVLTGVGPADQELKDIREQNIIPVVVAAHNFGQNLRNYSNSSGTFFPGDSPYVIVVGDVEPNLKGVSKDPNNKTIYQTNPTTNLIPNDAYHVTWDYTNSSPLFGNGIGSNFREGNRMVWAPGAAIDVARFELDPNILKLKYPIYDKNSSNSGDKTYSVFGGTSAANPFTTGVVALMKSRNPNITVAQIENILYNTTFPKTATPHPNMIKDGLTQPVRIIDAEIAVREAIKLKTSGSKNPDDYIAKDYVGYFELDYGALNDNSNNNKPIGTLTKTDGTKIRILRTASNEEFKAANQPVVDMKGWEPSIT